MVYRPVNPKALNVLNQKYIGLVPKKWSSAKILAKKFGTSTWELAYKFGKRTTIHGVNRLLSEKSGKLERTIWLCAVVVALVAAVYVCLILSKRFNEGKFETVVDNTRYPVYRVVFPVITICNLNRLNWQRLEEAKQRFLPNEKSQEKLKLFEKIIGTYDDIRFANFDKFDVLAEEPLELLKNINFSLVFEFMTWRCDEMLAFCKWRHFKMNCCEIFSKRRTRSGLCWSFNTLETDEGRRMQRLDPYWPWHTGAAGPSTGLSLRVLLQPENNFPNRISERGVSVMVTEPFVWHKDPYIIPENTQTTVEIEPIIYFYDNDTRIISSDQRQCVFADERNSLDYKTLQGYVYMIENCESQCHQEYLVRYCNCTLDLLFPPGPYTSCKSTDLPCLALNNEYLRYTRQPGEEKFVRLFYDAMLCKCYRNCFSLNYFADVRPSFIPPEVRGNMSYVDLDVFFRYESMMVYRTRLIFGWVDLLVAFGGIAGLFLGCSLISAMEIVYFVFVELPNYLSQRIRDKLQERRIETNNNLSSNTINHNITQNQFEEYVLNGRKQNKFISRPVWN
ncbi:pickpocket protein 19 [Teleopsis dalmanni]|uniref:pickpocket protein 19 n=1 Tax=Teleopsis dalmanni TaxID=139649 RepID=UPI0018CCCDE7|nr:pickpocket protein 19 [Teleopsis dalmanni]